MRHICSGENTCGMVKRDHQGNVTHVSDQMNICAGRINGGHGIHCGLVRGIVYFEHGEQSRRKEVREETLFQLRMDRNETKGDFMNRMRRAANGPYECKPGMREYPVRYM